MTYYCFVLGVGPSPKKMRILIPRKKLRDFMRLLERGSKNEASQIASDAISDRMPPYVEGVFNPVHVIANTLWACPFSIISNSTNLQEFPAN